jgi:hypothetical protein
VTRDSGGEAPTLEQVISQIQQERWEDIGALISDMGTAFQKSKQSASRFESASTNTPAQALAIRPPSRPTALLAAQATAGLDSS